MAQLTKMQQKIYDYIVQAIQDQGYPPSVREIGEAVGLKSPSTVHFHLKHLEELGVIGRYGFYEAIDFTPERVPTGKRFALVRSYMAHHHGMTLGALGNVLFEI